MVTYFVVTGFGKFRGVDQNPSQALVQALQAHIIERGKGIAGGAQVLVASILTVSAKYVDAWLAALVEELPQFISDTDELVLLHFGVDDKCEVDLKLEARAYNEATFRVPDESGWQPQGEPIDRDDAHAALETDLPVGMLAGSLRAAGGSRPPQQGV
ncbi:hypothetical protein WJX81_007794 [Elliptochloris bilobata]|uniref:Uncharacterized protein n=1 Tax=Elliptochloris bilobata TaxID=381761 RepID=A0AAW1SBQ4_9CHLO